MTPVIALMALTALGLPGEPFHEPFHGPATATATQRYHAPGAGPAIRSGRQRRRAQLSARHRTGPSAASWSARASAGTAGHAENSAWSPPHSHARRRIAMHAPCGQLRRALQLHSFPAITRNAEYERLPGRHRQHRERHRLSLLLFGGPLRMISFGREALPHSYLADTGPD